MFTKETEERTLFSRRDIVKQGALASGAGVLAIAGLASCSPLEKSGGEKEGASGEDAGWDEEYDVLVVGSGCGLYAALVAAQEGASVCVIEKASLLGGTTALSGNMCWVPNNRHMEEEGIEEASPSQILSYLVAADAYCDARPEILEHFVAHARDTFSYLEDDIQLPMGIRMSLPLRGDYYDLPGALPQGRSMDFLDSEGKPAGNKTIEKLILPKIQEKGVATKTETTLRSLIIDEDGTVIGLTAKGKGNKTIRLKGKKAVILASGGFDWNESMVNAYLRGPLFSSVGVDSNTGDGHRAALEIGAALGNMQNCWGVQAIIVDDAEGYSKVSDWGTYRSKPNSLLVNQKGRRFTNEASSYSTCNPSFYAYDTSTCSYMNIPAFLVFDQTYVDYYGFPGVKTKEGEKPSMPSYVSSFDSLSDLAVAFSIDEDNLLDEVSRFNDFAKSGNDPDWHRGRWEFDTKANGDSAHKQEGLANSCMGPVEHAPFYCLKMGPGCCGTSGGVLVNKNAQAISAVTGQPIGGLYAMGNCAASIFGSAYPGSGATVGAGIFQGLMAVQHALGYNKY